MSIYTTKDGFSGNIKEISKYYGININTLIARLNKGMTIDEAIKY